MNLFGGQKTESTPTPDYDVARQAIDEAGRKRMMRGRAASMLSAANQVTPTAQRQVTGN